MTKKFKKILLITTLVGGVWMGGYALKNDFGLGVNMELVVNMMRELSLNYVDEVNPNILMEGAAKGMVRGLDPYTEYIPEKEMSAFEIMTTGKYGGIGSLIRPKDDYIRIAQPYEGSPADKAGLKIGDKILAIDGVNAKGFKSEEVSSRLKGDPGTMVKVTVEHLDGSQETYDIQRERIAIPGVPFAGWVNDSIALVRHSDFTEGCYEEMRKAIEELNATGRLKGLVLDLRSNGGGILQEAVKIVSMFVDKGTEVVTTKGRAKNAEVKFLTEKKPSFPDLPLAVLINNQTASAAEIVSGSLQDLDRAVLVGQRSFGKGLVQTTRPLGYNTMLKLTTAKYYIPSGRCIQAIDYSHSQQGEVKVVADSLIKEFKTRGGRKIYDGGGIMPDIKTEPDYICRFAITLFAKGLIDDFGDDYMRKHPDLKIEDVRTFTISDQDYAWFTEWMKDKKVDYESATRRAIKILKEAAKDDLFEHLTEQFEAVEANLKDDTQANLKTYKEQIIESINTDLIQRQAYLRGVIEHSIPMDEELQRAAQILADTTEYHRILREQDTLKK